MLKLIVIRISEPCLGSDMELVAHYQIKGPFNVGVVML